MPVETATLKFLVGYVRDLTKLETLLEASKMVDATKAEAIVQAILEAADALKAATRKRALKLMQVIADETGPVPNAVKERMAKLLSSALEEIGLQIEDEARAIAAEGSSRQIETAIEVTTREIISTSLTGKLSSKVDAIIAAGGGKTKLKEKLMGALPKEVIINGKVYPREWYATLVSHQTAAEMDREAVLWTAEEVENDLVVVSNNLSKIGDFCNAYAGKVFSISGKTKGFHPISELPNGGPPFHPFCWHRWFTWTYPQSEADRKVDPQYLLGSGDTVRDVANRWWSTHKMLKTPASHRHKTGGGA